MNRGRRRGRPLDRGRDERILGTTIELLEDTGFDRFRMQDVAERAQVGLGTIYRRWPTKGDLIVAALRWAMADTDGNSHTLDGLRGQLDDLASIVHTQQVDLLPGLIAAAHRDPELAAAFRASWMKPRMDALRHAVEGAGADGLDGDITELIADIGPALLILRALVTHEPLGEDTVDRIMEDLVIPLLSLHATRKAERASDIDLRDA